MQRLGAEMNLSETVFIIADKGTFDDAQSFGIRWFTPTTEVDLCGHATLASAAVLFFKKGNKNDAITFHSRSGELIARRAESGRILLDFPANPPFEMQKEDFKDLLEVCLKDISLVHSVHLNKKTRKLLVRLIDSISRNDLEALSPRIDEMIASEHTGLIRGVGLTVKGSQTNGCVDNEGKVYDFISRYFAPWAGIPEDPVTGSWHTVSACYWSQQLQKKSVYARQCSRRGGDLWVDLQDDRVTISGNAVINLEGIFTL
ncbi:phenazine biosynthesis-like domain-containing protein [Plakobranchus ocellatus]|uniref:Phenazine biosynthesis-like domain-containing protein n=1 Tax=Plakobranchus ocellatus TaxID=259542 RepID=A0AAV4C1G3_9GAST|nr:phenazine biosynthesis-like domain-containing protein [Plakobranchus ocellatus]